MKKISIGVLMLIPLICGSAYAQDLTGTYILAYQGVTLTLVFQQDPQGNLMGSLSSTTGQRYQIGGMIQDGVGVGACYDQAGAVFFEAHPQPGNQLLLALFEAGANNMPDTNNVKQLMFTKQGGSMPPAGPGQMPGMAPPSTPFTPGMTPGSGMTPGQMPGQLPSQMPGQTPGQMPGMTTPGTPSTPGMTPGQMPGQLPSQMPGQMPGMTPPGTPSSPGMTPGPGMTQATAQERYLAGKYCNRGGEAMWAYFDGQGNFQYGTSAPEGYGAYRVVGNAVQLMYPDGSSESVQIVQRAQDGSITALQYEGQVFTPQLCY